MNLEEMRLENDIVFQIMQNEIKEMISGEENIEDDARTEQKREGIAVHHRATNGNNKLLDKPLSYYT